MSETAQREWRFYLDDMIVFAETLWSIIQDDVPDLLQQLLLLKDQYQ